jgi:hypothetical protein
MTATAGVTVMISRPEHGLEIVSMSFEKWLDKKGFVFYPDAVDRISSDYPLAGVTVGCKWQGHFVLASEHREKWVLSGTRMADIDLEFFSPEWRGCTATLLRM